MISFGVILKMMFGIVSIVIVMRSGSGVFFYIFKVVGFLVELYCVEEFDDVGKG